MSISKVALSQEGSIDKCIERLLDNQSEIELSNEIDIAQIQNDLEFLLKNPININSKSFQVFVHYGIITQNQYNALQEHIGKYGELKAIEELQLIVEFDNELILILSDFLSTKNFAEKISFANEITEAKNDLTLHYNQLIQTRSGFIGSDKNYQGHPSRLMVKFKTQFYSKWRLGLNFEKDAGEEFAWEWNKNRRGFDHSSFYLEYKSKAILRTFILGDYQLRLGQGLTFWKGFAFKKSTNSIGIRKVANELKAHTGMDEVNYMRGICFDLKYKKWQLIPFFSFRKIDARLTGNAEASIRSIQTSGLHRSINEINNKASVDELILGTYLAYTFSNLKLGSSFTYQQFNTPYNFKNTLSNAFPFNGSQNYLVGIDADYMFKNGHAFSEISRSANNALSYLFGLVISPDKRLSFAFYYRKFAIDFQPISSNAFGELSFNKNEEGFYLGLQFSPLNKLIINAYYDLYRMPWVSNKSSGNDLVFSGLIPINRKTKCNVKYRVSIQNDRYTQQAIRHKFRIQNEHALSDKFQLRYRLAFHYLKNVIKSNGYLFFIDLVFQNPESPLSISTRYALFNTDDYNTRIYAYERDAYFTYSVRPYYYKGQKIYLNVKFRMRRFFTFFLRFSHITYPFLETLGSSNDLINGNKKSEFTLQVRLRW